MSLNITFDDDWGLEKNGLLEPEKKHEIAIYDEGTQARLSYSLANKSEEDIILEPVSYLLNDQERSCDTTGLLFLSNKLRYYAGEKLGVDYRVLAQKYFHIGPGEDFDLSVLVNAKVLNEGRPKNWSEDIDFGYIGFRFKLHIKDEEYYVRTRMNIIG